MFDLLAKGFALVLNIPCLLYLSAGTILGIVFGSIPGLTTTMGLAVAIPISFTLNPVQAMALLLGSLCGGVSGGLISAILLNIPGTPSAVATTFDGHPMALKGQAGKALGIGILYSFMGTLLGFLALVTVSPVLASWGLKFGPREYFAVGVFSLTIISSLVGKSVLKGLGSAALGMMLALIGMAPVDGARRLTFGIRDLDSGFRMLTLIIGFYALGSLFQYAEKKKKDESFTVIQYKMRGFGITVKDFLGQTWNMIRSAAIGVAIGILPGLGGNISNLVAYATAKKQSKHPEEFGTGIIDGIIASETSNNATFGAAFIPLLTLGVPGDNAGAMILGVLMVHGIQPGPLLFQTQGDWVYAVFILVLLAAFVMLIVELSALPLFVKLLSIPKYMLLPTVAVISIIGVFSSSRLIMDVWVCLGFGLFSIVMKKLRIPLAPMVISFVLTPMIETNFRRGLMMSPNDSFWFFFESSIFNVFIGITILTVLLNAIKNTRKKKNN